MMHCQNIAAPPQKKKKLTGSPSTVGILGEVPAPRRRWAQQKACRAEGGSPPAPSRGRGLTHTFISLADSYTPTVRRSWRCAATSSSSTAALTVCILGQGRGGQRPAGHRAPEPPSGPADLRLLTSAPRCRTPPALPGSCCSYNPQWKAPPRQCHWRKRRPRGRRARTLPTELERSS